MFVIEFEDEDGNRRLVCTSQWNEVTQLREYQNVQATYQVDTEDAAAAREMVAARGVQPNWLNTPKPTPGELALQAESMKKPQVLTVEILEKSGLV